MALALVCALASAQTVRVKAPAVVAADEQFTVSFTIDGEKAPKEFSWSPGDDFQLVWGPQKGTSSSIQIINGKTTRSSQTTYTYVLLPRATGRFTLAPAVANFGKDKEVASPSVTIEVVSNGAASQAGQSSSAAAGSAAGASQAAATGSIPDKDIFLRFALSKTDVVLGEPITATLKLYQQVNIAGFENVKLPTFNGFWSQEVQAPTNIEFHRESVDDKIYNAALIRSYVIIPQQTGTLVIEPAEMVCLVNVRRELRSSNPLDIFFQDDYQTLRKRVTSTSYKVRVSGLPGGAPAGFGGGVGNFTLSARLSKDSLKAHDAASLLVTVSGRGNVSLLEAPKIAFPPDFEVYDTKVTENVTAGGTQGSKTFEYPFIPRSHGDFTLGPVTYSYYDTGTRSYQTLQSQPLELSVARGEGGESVQTVSTAPTASLRKGVKDLGTDIRFVATRQPRLVEEGHFFLGSGWFWTLFLLLAAATAGTYFAVRGYAARRADVVGEKNRRATKMARARLKQAGEFLSKNLYTAFYEELHKALLGFISDKLNMDQADLNKDNIAQALLAGGVPQDQTDAFTGLLDACEFARYAPDAGHEAMDAHYQEALKVISSIDAKMKHKSVTPSRTLSVLVFLLCGTMAFSISTRAAEAAPLPEEHNPSYTATRGEVAASNRQLVEASASDRQLGEASASNRQLGEATVSDKQLWEEATAAYQEGRWSDAVTAYEAILATGRTAPELQYNLGNAWFKAGEPARAILCYERALKLDPSYDDARYNLEFAREQTQDRIDVVPEFIIERWGRSACYLLDSDTWTVLFFVFAAVFAVLLLAFLLSARTSWKRVGFYGGIVVLLLALLCLDFAHWQLADYRKADSAIVMRPVCSAKSSPSEASAKDLFVLHEGTKVKILDEVGGWKNIELSDGRTGWVPASDIEVI